MVDSHYSLICLVCIIDISIILFQHIKYYKHSEYNRNFVILALSCLVFSAVDVLWGLIASDSIFFKDWLFSVSTAYHILASFVAFNFAFFIFYFNKENFKHLKLIAVMSFGPLAALLGIFIYNIKSRTVFYIDENGLYCRGDFNIIKLVYLLFYFYFVCSLIISVYSYVHASRRNKRFSRSVIFFSVFPIIATVFQYNDPWIPYLSIGYSSACLLVYSFENTFEQLVNEKNKLDGRLKKILDECTLLLQSEQLPVKNIEKMLQLVTTYYDAEDVYIDEFEEETFVVRNSYYWNNGKPPRHDNDTINNLPRSTLNEWYEAYKARTEIFVPDTQAPGVIKSYAEFSKRHHIKNAMSIPIVFNGKMKGLFTVYNMANYKNDFTILRTLSFFVLSEIIKRRTMEEAEAERRSVISALSDGYDCVYFLNLDSDKITLYRHDEKVNRFFNIKDNETVPFTSSYKVYVENLVIAEDQEELLEFGSVNVLKSVLRGRKFITKKFRSNISGKSEFFEAKWVKVEPENQEARFVVLCYSNIDEKIQQHLLEEKERELVQARLTSAIETAEAATHESQLDKLTGLYNKCSGLDIMAKFLNAKTESEQYGLLFIDLDKFKEINDTYGHLEGDAILKGVGEVIKTKCRSGDIAVRFGGDEFIVLLKNVTDTSLLENKAKQISEGINKLATGKFYFTKCSVGGYISSARDLQSVMDEADHALYYVKENGRDGIKILKEID